MDKTKIAIDVFNSHARAYQDKFMDTYLYHDTFDMFCNNIAVENAAILDIACGPGNITRYLLGKRPDLRISGIDLAPAMLELASANNPGAEFSLMDCRQINSLNKKYDGIMCGFCLPYLSKDEAKQLIFDAAQILYTGGSLYISTMEDDYIKSGWQVSSSGDKVYMYFHQADYLGDTFIESGFNILAIERKVYPAADGTITTDLIMIAVKKELVKHF